MCPQETLGDSSCHPQVPPSQGRFSLTCSKKDSRRVTPLYCNRSGVLKHFELQNVQSVGTSICLPKPFIFTGRRTTFEWK